MSVLEVGDRVLVQDLEVDFDLLDSDRLAPVCEIVKDEATVKSKVKRLKNELYFKKKALAEKEGEDATRKEKSVSDQQASDSEDAKEDGEEDGQDDVEPRIGKVLRGFLKTRPSSERSDSQDKPKNPKFQKRRLVGTSLPQKGKYKRVGTGDSKVDSTGQKDVPKKMVSTRKKGRQRTEVGKSGKAGNGKWTNTSKKPKTNSAKVGAKRKGKV